MPNPMTTMTAVPRRKVQVGFNYPWLWNAYGIYFGSGLQPGADPVLDAWPRVLRKNLERIRDDLGIRIVRLFLMCNAANYGTVTFRETFSDWAWDFSFPSSLHPAFADRFQEALGHFADLRMQVIPVLVDFNAFCDSAPDLVNGRTGRGQILSSRSNQSRFLDMVLEPLLDRSLSAPETIFAWEVINEPIWCVSSVSPMTVHSIDEDRMTEFLHDAVGRIKARHAFAATVGHRFSKDLETWRDDRVLRQFHYYPANRLASVLPLTERALPTFADTQAFIGEFGTKLNNQPMEGTWPDVDAMDVSLEQDTRKRVYWRLKTLEAKGYSLAFVWPDLPDTPADRAPPATDPLKFSSESLAGIREYIIEP